MWSVTAKRMRCVSFRAEVTFRHSPPNFRLVRLSSAHCVHTRISIVTFITAAIARLKEEKTSQRPVIGPRTNSGNL